MPGGIHPPPDVYLAWPKPNYINPQLRDWTLAATVVILLCLTITIVCARLWARIVLQRNAGIDDAIIVVAMIPTIGLAISLILGSRMYGFDRHAWDLLPGMAVKSRQITMAIEAFYVMSTSLTKISILLFYRRMAAGSISPLFHWVVRIAMASVVAYLITFELTLFLGCRPIDSFWNQVDFIWETTHKAGVDYHCFSEPANALAASGISIIQDFMACGMPIILFWKLNLPFRQKAALAAVFGVGFLLCITGILRIVYIYNIYFVTYDVNWSAQPAWIWTGVEAHVAIICASAPALKAFFKKYFNVTGFTDSLPSGWWRTKRRSTLYPKMEKTYLSNATDPISSVQTNSTRSRVSKREITVSEIDIELGGIAVTKEIEVESAHGEQSRNRGGAKPQFLSFPSNELPWLDDQSTITQTPRTKSPPYKAR